MKHRKINNDLRIVRTTEAFIGMSLEEKVFQAVNNNTPIEAVAPMTYTERKDGVLPETNIRTDRFEVAQEAMTQIAEGIRVKRANRQQAKVVDKPASGSGSETSQSVPLN